MIMKTKHEGTATHQYATSRKAPLLDAGSDENTQGQTPLSGGHKCIACGREHDGCCGQCPEWKPLTMPDPLLPATETVRRLTHLAPHSPNECAQVELVISTALTKHALAAAPESGMERNAVALLRRCCDTLNDSALHHAPIIEEVEAFLERHDSARKEGK